MIVRNPKVPLYRDYENICTECDVECNEICHHCGDKKETQKYDLVIQANKTYPGRLVVQEGTEDEIVQGIKEILKTHSIERYHTKIIIWNHSIAEKLEVKN